MAGPITFLSSDMASYVTGIVLNVDGLLTGASPGKQAHDSWTDPKQEHPEPHFEELLASLVI